MSRGGAIGVFQPGTSVLHRIPAGWKLLGMAVAVTAALLLRQWWQLAIAAALTLVLYLLGGFGVRVLLAQLRPLRWMLLFVAVIQLLIAGWPTALRVCLVLSVTVALAALYTLTTRVSQTLDLVARALAPLRRKPLRRLGIDPDRIALVLAMTIRCVPLLAGVIDEVNQARRARGAGWSVRAIAVPAVVRTLRVADAMGEALQARGADDPDPADPRPPAAGPASGGS